VNYELKGGHGNKNDESDVHLPQRQNKSRHLLYFVFIFIFYRFFLRRFFGRFVTRGVQKQGKNLFSKKNIWAHHKKCGFFFLLFFCFSFGCFVRFFFNRVFGRFVTRGVQKREKTNRAKISSASKKSTYLRHFFSFFTAPLDELREKRR
jgi:hypothetical protein